jgi:glycosyltransferase involved in cell wall biosynthesis
VSTAASPRPAPAPAAATDTLRLAVFTSHPIQYQAPLFRALASRPGVEPTVYFGSRHGLDEAADREFGTAFRWDVPLVDGYDHVFLSNRARRPDVSRFGGIRVPDVARHWAAGRFDAALVLGWQSVGHLQAMRAAHAAGIPLLVRGESHLGTGEGSGVRTRLRRALWYPVRERVYRSMLARAAGVVAIGTRNAEFYRHFGVAEDRLHLATYCVDNRRFALDDGERARARAGLRAAWGVAEGATVFVASGKLVPRKRPLDVVAAAALAAAAGHDVHVVFVGDGGERGALLARAAALGIAGRVRVAGFVNQRELPRWYAAADALVLASEASETWGLVVNEAMAAGLPVLVSAAAGCAPDLVREGFNGWTFPVGGVEALAGRMGALAALPAEARAAMGAVSRAVVGEATVERAAEVVERAARGAAARRTA